MLPPPHAQRYRLPWAATAAGAAFAAKWERLAGAGHRLTAGDLANLSHVGALMATLSQGADEKAPGASVFADHHPLPVDWSGAGFSGVTR